jgi:hypothetical protein
LADCLFSIPASIQYACPISDEVEWRPATSLLGVVTTDTVEWFFLKVKPFDSSSCSLRLALPRRYVSREKFTTINTAIIHMRIVEQMYGRFDSQR